MSITDELREWAKTLTHWWYDPVKDEYTYTTGIMPPSIDAIRLDSNIIAIADRIDVEHDKALNSVDDAYDSGYNVGYDNGFASADDWLAQHEDAMAEHGWIRLPKDADGVPWHIGDRTESGQTIQAMGLNKHGWHFVGVVNEIDPAIHRHHHTPTVEDVLREFSEKMNENLGMYTGEAIDADEWREADAKTIAEYAKRLTLAEREDA